MAIMKKSFLLFIAAAVTFTLCACGGDGTDTQKSTAKVTDKATAPVTETVTQKDTTSTVTDGVTVIPDDTAAESDKAGLGDLITDAVSEANFLKDRYMK